MRFIYLIAISATFLLSSCQFFQASNTGKGTTFQYGKMEGFIQSSLPKVHTAAAKAIKSLELLTVSSKKDALISIYEAQNAKSESITITIEKISEDSVKVYIKVGLIGDQMYSQAIYDAIKKNL
ncbi:MAG: DUF3568 domain-containing protein [Lentisphaeraceae bacterium]|nr:DUF3568 domain-containing protein [Lentisphaeraceae bacterium]